MAIADPATRINTKAYRAGWLTLRLSWPSQREVERRRTGLFLAGVAFGVGFRSGGRVGNLAGASDGNHRRSATVSTAAGASGSSRSTGTGHTSVDRPFPVPKLIRGGGAAAGRSAAGRLRRSGGGGSRATVTTLSSGTVDTAEH